MGDDGVERALIPELYALEWSPCEVCSWLQGLQFGLYIEACACRA